MGYISVLLFACYIGMVFLAASKIEALEKEGKNKHFIIRGSIQLLLTRFSL